MGVGVFFKVLGLLSLTLSEVCPIPNKKSNSAINKHRTRFLCIVFLGGGVSGGGGLLFF